MAVNKSHTTKEDFSLIPKETTTTVEKPNAVKRIKLSFKAGLGIGNTKSSTSPSHTPSSAAQANGDRTKDGDEG